MENNLQISDDPRKLPFKLIKKITKDFAEDRILGRGAFGTVYKGVNEDGEHIAVKVLHSLPGIDDQQFQNEFDNLKRLEHPNIVRLVGFCDETEEAVAMHEEKLVNCVKIHRALCLEYVTNGSLRKLLLSGKLLGNSWPIRYKIIKGICEGLKYLHEGLDDPILHFDLKLDNILLDEEMMPKIADFGLSRLLGEENTKRTITPLGTFGYLPPEFLTNQVISKEYDIFSLGVVIKKIITCGIVDSEMDAQEFIEHVHDNWMRNLQEILRCALPDADCKQAKRCMQLAVNCMKYDRRKRPTMKEVVSKLNEIEQCQCEESLVLCSPPEEMAEVVLLAIRKIDNVLADETAKAMLANLGVLEYRIEEIRKQLIEMNNVIRQIGTVYLTDEVVRGWIGEVQKLAYHVEDVMDKYTYYSHKMEEEGALKKYFIKGPLYVLVLSQIADEVIMIEKETVQIIELKHQWLQPSQLFPDQLNEMVRQRSQDSFPQLVKDEDLVGIEGNRRILTEWLYSDELESTVITVSGMGGLGKTTLVTNVYEREKINFPAHAWMVVSQTYTMDALLRKLLRKVGYVEQQLSANIDRMDVYDLKEETKKMLKNRKCLIVLDDVWNQDVYFQLCDAFQNYKASRMIITTRKNHVAALALSTRHLDLQPLSKTHAFELFRRRAFYNKKDHACPELLKVATSIVDRCQGLPLAIVSIGRLLSLRPRTHYIWNQMWNQLRSELSNNDNVRAIFNLSYHDLSGDLRNCFLYCSLFPEDYPISRESLVRMWVAEGFVLRKGKNTAEEVAELNLMELIHRNMLVILEIDEQGRVNTCTMHDIVRELALGVAKQKGFGSANDYGTMIQMDKDVRRLSSYEWKDNTTLKVRFPRLRTLVSLGTISASPHMLSSIFSESSYLTVLELQDSEVTEVPASIGILFNLRYIGLRRTKVRSLPESVEKLCNLQTLDIKQTKIEKLPRGIAKVKKLQHLLADRFDDENDHSVFAMLKKLQHLLTNRYDDENHSAFRYFKGIQVPKDLSNLEELQTLETVEASEDLSDQLKKLMQLRSLWIDNISSTDCSNLFATLSDMPLLSTLLLSARDENEALCFDALKPKSTEFHKLIIRGQWAKKTLECPIFRGYGMHLKYLAISWCHLREDPLKMLAHLPNLTNLRLNNMSSAEILVLPAGSFCHLKLLILKHMHNVKELVIGKGAIPCIEGLYIVSLPELDKVPQGIESLRSLKKLWLLKLHSGFVTQWNESEMHRKLQHVLEIRV